MSLSVLLCVLLSCGLTLGVPHETQTCVPDECNLLKELGALTEKQKTVEAKLKESEDKILELQKKASKKVVFSAAVGGSGAIGPFPTDTTVKYRTVRTNLGSAYNPSTGIFTAPVQGIYHFSFFYHAGGSHYAHLVLIQNDGKVAEAYDHKTNADTADNGGNAVFLHLEQGDNVFVRLGANTHIWGNDHISTFSGFLLYEV
ncbi:unnamed protein product [Menidia menidia]|uniref:(Atlantic silverside) hypothetical protein n=1 Tax=Menidia menidia TaxID=238744 RepID=A0A8S4BEK4_9TELE|nr:unnamed protein product [Menidia menidia]